MKTLKLTLSILIGILINAGNLFGQAANVGHLGAGGDWLGWDSGTTINLDFIHAGPHNVNFFTDSVQRMTILGPLGYNQGFVGVNLPGPRLNLEVQSNIGIIPTVFDHSYRIDSIPMLRSWPYNFGFLTNIFVGANAGLNNNNTAGRLTFIGFEAGLNNTTGGDGTFVGHEAGHVNTSGIMNVFVGSGAGVASTVGNHNVFLGTLSGQGNVAGSHNTAIGDRSYSSSLSNFDNTSIGFNSAINLANGDSNLYGGAYSGFNQTGGSNNVILGANAGGATFNTGSTLPLIGANSAAGNNLSNSTALGANSIVNNNNNMVLGANNVNVGIGFSGAPVGNGPATKLEINTDPLNFIYAGLDQSGLRFTQLISTSTATPGITRFLTVNNNGDVILGDIPGGGGSVNACPAGLTNVNYITKITGLNAICKTEGIYESSSAPFTVGIGVAASPNVGPYNNFKLDIQNDLYLRHKYNNNLGSDIGGDIWMQSHTGQPKRVFSMYGYFGERAVAIGPNAGSSIQFADQNTNNCVYIGVNCGPLSFDDNNNTFLGGATGQFWDGTTSDGFNTLIGAGIGGISFVTGDRNTMIGDKSAFSFIEGDDNVFAGENSARSLQRGSENAMFGAYTTSSRDATRLVLLGNYATAQAGSVIDNSVSIGHDNWVQCSNCVTMAAQPYSATEQQVGIGITSPATTVIPAPAPPLTAAKLYVSSFNGGTTSAYFAGTVYATAFTVVSDSALKQNIQPLTDVNDIMNQLEAKTYDFKIMDYPALNLPNGNQAGFLAHEIEAIAPQLITYVSHPAEYDSAGNITSSQTNFKSVNYAGLVPILFTAIKQQQARMDSLEILIDNCCAAPVNPNNGNKASINLNNKASIILNQNAPNPFKDKTEITYSIPENIKSAAILFYDQSGKILNTYEITHAGEGTLVVYGDNLTGGIYTYSLLINGEPVKTKRMVKE